MGCDLMIIRKYVSQSETSCDTLRSKSIYLRVVGDFISE